MLFGRNALSRNKMLEIGAFAGFLKFLIISVTDITGPIQPNKDVPFAT